jgi:hypothetical protein
LAQAARDSDAAACDTVLAAATAALASAQALAVIDNCGQQPPAALNGTLELVLPDWQWRRRGWPPSPSCACGAAGKADDSGYVGGYVGGHVDIADRDREENHAPRPA